MHVTALDQFLLLFLQVNDLYLTIPTTDNDLALLLTVGDHV
jgi:hypothetical protein